jgi:hypothetical protein
MKFFLLLLSLTSIGNSLLAQGTQVRSNDARAIRNSDSTVVILGSNDKGVQGVFYKKNNGRVEFKAGEFRSTSNPAKNAENLRTSNSATRPVAKGPSPDVPPSPVLSSHR